MQCVVLAGGLGTRMGAWTGRMPKTLIPVAGRPFAELQMEWLAAEGVSEVVYSVGYLGSMIRDALGDGERWGSTITYVDEGTELRGTAGALRLAADLGVLQDSFVVMYGDSFLQLRLEDLWTAYVGRTQAALMGVYRNLDQLDRSNVVYVNGQVCLYDKRSMDKPLEMDYIDYGISVLSRDVICEQVPQLETVDLADVFHTLSLQGALGGYEVRERFYEIGSPEGLCDLERYLQAMALRDPRRPVPTRASGAPGRSRRGRPTRWS